MTTFEKVEKELIQLYTALTQCDTQKKVLESQLDPNPTWATKAKNANIRDQIAGIQTQISKLKKTIDTKTTEAEKLLIGKEKFAKFLEPILKAGYLVYDDGEYAYTAQQFKILQSCNEISEGCYLHNPKLYKRASKFFRSQGISLKTSKLPGNPVLLDPEYKRFITQVGSDLRACCFGNIAPLTVIYDGGIRLTL
jgi:hypothetical protein